MNRETGKELDPIGRRCLLALVLLCVASLIAHLACFPALPDIVPTHFGASGEVNGWGSKWGTLLLDALPLGLLVLFRLVPRIDPRGNAYEKFGGAYRIFVIMLTGFMVIMTWTTEAMTFGWVSSTDTGKLFPLFTGVLLVVIGNYLPRVRHNYTMGVRTPWALQDPENWRRTQRFGGIWFVVSGLAFIASGILDGGVAGVIISFTLTIAGGLATFAYSYLLWRNSR